MVYKNIIEAIGNTPIVKLNVVSASTQAHIYAKCEMLNPGGSIKDRIGYWLIEDFEKKGQLKPGGTIVEGTSGNTGFGLAIAAAIKGYQCIFVLSDKMSDEKVKNLRAFGAKVIVTPSAVEPDDPRSYTSVAKRLGAEIPNAVHINQYHNTANRDCHFQTTGPEIYKQMPDVDVIVAGIGTGGTVCGIGRYFKQVNPRVEIVAVDPEGSMVYDYFKTGKMIKARPYKVEGIGEDFIPDNYDLSVLNDVIPIDDRSSFLMTRDLLKKEGIFAGGSSGSAVAGAIKWCNQQGARLQGKKVLVILPDSGNRYLSKVFNDEWMKENSFLETRSLGSIEDLLKHKSKKNLHMASPQDSIKRTIDLFQTEGISQVPIIHNKVLLGVAHEAKILSALVDGKIRISDPLEAVMDTNFCIFKSSEQLEAGFNAIKKGLTPLVENPDGTYSIFTKIDLISYLGAKS